VTVASPLTVTLEGDSAAVNAVTLTSYVPVVGDVVQVLLNPGALPLVLGDVLTTQDGLPSVVTDSTGVGPTSGTTELVIATAASVTLDGTTRVRVRYEAARIDTTINGDVFTFRIKDGSTVMRAFRYNAPGLAADGINFEWISDTAPSAAAHVFTAAVVRSSGTGTLQINGSSVNIAQFSVSRFR
jgi:hypothetical protein